MSKYGDVIRHARQTEHQAEMQTTSASNEESVDQQTRKMENQKNGKPENQKEQAKASEAKTEEVNLSIKVPKTLRRHWVAEAKRHDTTLTAVIIEALKARFGEPLDT